MTDEAELRRLLNQDLDSPSVPTDIVARAIETSNRQLIGLDVLHFGVGSVFATLLQLVAPLIAMVTPFFGEKMTWRDARRRH